jgi:hypothetical protein
VFLSDWLASSRRGAFNNKLPERREEGGELAVYRSAVGTEAADVNEQIGGL